MWPNVRSAGRELPRDCACSIPTINNRRPCRQRLSLGSGCTKPLGAQRTPRKFSVIPTAGGSATPSHCRQHTGGTFGYCRCRVCSRGNSRRASRGFFALAIAPHRHLSPTGDCALYVSPALIPGPMVSFGGGLALYSGHGRQSRPAVDSRAAMAALSPCTGSFVTQRLRQHGPLILPGRR